MLAFKPTLSPHRLLLQLIQCSVLTFRQGVQESNPQPTVLETVALPIELTPYKTHFMCLSLTWFPGATGVPGIVYNTS